MTSEYCKLYSLIYDPDEKMWIFEFSLGVCSTEQHDFVHSLGYLVSNERQILQGDIRLDGSATSIHLCYRMLACRSSCDYPTPSRCLGTCPLA